MNKAFLSHNSFDKDFVGMVFEELGALHSVYDKETFKKNCDLSDQIRSGINDCQVYVLFLSKGSIDSGWVSNEIDLANELKTKWQIKSFLIFQLDESDWSSLPSWASRYVTSCPPSPKQVALRIKDELRKSKPQEQEPYGRDNEIRKLNEAILEREETPKFLFLSGPEGIGRRTVASSLYKTFYKEVATHKISIEFGENEDIHTLYRRLLGFSSNWRARELHNESEAFSNLAPHEQIQNLAKLIFSVSVGFQQVIILDIGKFGFDVNQKPLAWLKSLLDALMNAPYPYLIILSSRYMHDQVDSGVYFHLNPLNEENSRYLFKMMISHQKIKFPDKKEKENVEQSIVGHPGLIVAVVNYLRKNPHYRPNKTHNSIIQIIKNQVEKMLLDFLQNQPQLERSIALFGEAFVMSYAEIAAVTSCWPEFDDAVSSLLDAGFIIQHNDNYQLASYIVRYAQNIARKYEDSLRDARAILFKATDPVSEDSFVATQILDSRIVAHFTSGAEIPGYMINLVMPSQQLKAAKREYDGSRYNQSLTLSKEAYSQSSKLSEAGVVESWRLIGLSSIRIPSDDDFKFFLNEYNKIPYSQRRDSTHFFAQGFKSRLSGNLRDAIVNFEKIIRNPNPDSHSLREAAYIYAFDGRYDEASSCIEKAKKLAPSNPYILDIESLILLEKIRKFKDSSLISSLDESIDRLEDADSREGTSFSRIRKSMRDVLVHNDTNGIREIYNERERLPIHAKISLLEILSYKGKLDQYNTLNGELEKIIRESKNRMAEIEINRIQIEQLSYNGKTRDAEEILRRIGNKLTDSSIENLRKVIESSKAQASLSQKNF